MNVLAIAFLLSLVGGQLLGWTIWPGVVVYAHDILLVLLLVWAYATQIMDGTRVRLLHSLYAFFFVGLASLVLHISLFGGTLTFLSSLYLLRWFIYVEVYVLVASKKQKFPWTEWLYASSVLFAAVGLVQYLLYPDLRNLTYLGWDPHYYRLFSTLLDPNFAGIILVLGFFLGFGFIKRRPLLIVSELLLFAAFLLTYSRSSYLAFIAGIVTYACITKQRQLALGLLLLFFGAIAVLPIRDIDILRVNRLDSAVARLGNWERGMDLFGESPLIGWGFNTLRFVQTQRHWVDDTQIVSRAGGGLDNSFIFLLATTGVVGLASYLWILNSIILSARRNAVLLVSLAAIIVHAFFVNSLFYPWVMIWLWILAGAAERVQASGDT